MAILCIVLLCLLGYVWSLTYLNKQAVEANFLIATSLTVVWLYGFAYFGCLDLGVKLFLIGGGLFFLIFFLYAFRDREDFLDHYLTPGICIAVFFIMLLGFFSRHLTLSGWDEFAHWGCHAKVIDLRHGFMQSADNIPHKDYPPTGRLFYYVFYFLKGGYSESLSYLAQQLFMLAPLTVFIQRMSWKDRSTALVGYLFLLTLLALDHVKFGAEGSLYMDTMISVYMASMLIFYRSSLHRNYVTILWLVPTCITIVLMKPGLLFFILLFGLLVLCDQWYQLFRGPISKAAFLKSLGALFLCVASAFFALKSWEHFLASIQTPITNQANIHLSWSAIRPFLIAPLKNPTISHFLHALKGQPFLNLLGISAVLYVTLTILKNNKHGRDELLIEQGVLFCGCLAYLLGLLLLYLFTFSPYESVRLASFSRYFDIYALMCWIIIGRHLFAATKDSLWMDCYHKKLMFLGLIFMVYLFGINAYYYWHDGHKPLTFEIKAVESITELALKKIPADKKILPLWQNSSGIEQTIMQYDIMPRQFLDAPTSFGQPYSSEDAWTHNDTPSQFGAMLSQADYVLIGYADQNLWSHYSAFFPNHPETLAPLLRYSICMGHRAFNPFNVPGCQFTTQSAYLFKVVHGDHGTVSLVPVN